ncbi:PcfB family protein [Blautia obeum]|uniref:PcfB family protein n=1 Tax=Blautia obeum TaxID=40520 RepID=UPI001570BCE1|nr:PcfB family protein [Blautia obeum]
MQEELEQRTVSVSIQAAKLSGRVLRAAIAAVLQKMEQERTMPKVGRNSMKRLTYKDPGANTIEVSGRIRSFERYARKHQVRYHIEKELGTDPPKWTVYFKANQADALTAAFKEYTKKDLTRSTKPSLLIQLHKFKELAQSLGRDRVKNKEHGGPER